MAIDTNKDLFYDSCYDDENDTLYIKMVDVETGKFSFQKVVKPKLRVYQYKGDADIYREFVHMDDVMTHDISYKWKEYDIARLTGIRNFSELVKSGVMKRQMALLNKTMFGTDINIKDAYIMKYLDNFPHTTNPETGYEVYDDAPPIKNIHIGFLDIETDIRISDDRGAQPVYMITYIDGKHNVCYTYYLYNKEFKGIEILRQHQESTIEKMLKMLEEDVETLAIKDPNKKALIQGIIRKRMQTMKFYVKEYTSEKQMHTDMWQLVYRQYQPLFLLIYNASYDVSQTQMRAGVLGIKEKDLFTQPEVGEYINFDYSDQTFNPGKRNHKFESAAKTKIYCSQQLYYSIRRAEGFSSVALNTTAGRELGIRKLEYGHICGHIRDLPYEDFITTYMYNVRDVLLMVFLEDVLGDLTFMMTIRFLSRTEYDRVFTPLVTVSNSFYHVSLRNNKIMQPNINKLLARLDRKVIKELESTDKITADLAKAIIYREKIEGGFCSDPTKFDGDGKKSMLSFMSSNILVDIMDEDARSMYPFALISSRIAKSTLYGKLVGINGETFEDKDASYAYALSMINRDIINIGKLYFNLPTMSEAIEHLTGASLSQYIPTKHFRMKLDRFKSLYVDNTMKYNNLEKVLSTILNPKVSSKDKDKEDSRLDDTDNIEIGDPSNRDSYNLRGVYCLSKEEDVAFSYYGTLVKYYLHKDGSKVSTADYVGINKKLTEHFVSLNSVDGIVDNNIFTTHLKPREYDTPVLKDKHIVQNVSISKQISEMSDDNLELTSININGAKIDTVARLHTMNKKLFTASISTGICNDWKNIKSTSILSYSNIRYRVRGFSDKYTFTAKDDRDRDVTHLFTCDNDGLYLKGDLTEHKHITLIITNKETRKIKLIKYDIVDVKINVWTTNAKEDYVYIGEISYDKILDPVDRCYINMAQEFVFINY